MPGQFLPLQSLAAGSLLRLGFPLGSREHSGWAKVCLPSSWVPVGPASRQAGALRFLLLPLLCISFPTAAQEFVEGNSEEACSCSVGGRGVPSPPC